jgi:hypothetical protein
MKKPLMYALFLATVGAAAAGCGSSGSSGVNVQKAKTFHLVGFQPTGSVAPQRPVKVSFIIGQPSGQSLTHFKTGPGPHTGVHLIFVRSDLGAIIHLHPPIGPGGRLSIPVTFPTPGTYRTVIDVYPATSNVALRNFQLFSHVQVRGHAVHMPLPPFKPTVKVDGYTFALHGNPRLRAVTPAFLKFTVTDPRGRPVHFTPWYGALAHAIFFRTKSLDYFHTHVCAPGASGCTSVLGGAKVTGHSSAPGVLNVGVLVPIGGSWRLFLQIRDHGHVLTAPFTLHVR